MHGIAESKTLARMALTLGFCFLAGSVSAESLVVFESSSDTFTPGQTIDGAKTLTLVNGQTVSLISNSGKIVRLSGPFSGVPAPKGGGEAGSVKGALEKLLAAPSKDSSSLGLARNADDVLALAEQEGALPDPWLIDVSAGGDQCVRADEQVVFWRGEASAQTDVQVRTGDGWEARTEWSAGKTKLALPETMSFRDGDTMQIEIGGTATENTIHVVPSGLSGIPALAAWMKGNGCRNQFLSMVRGAM